MSRRVFIIILNYNNASDTIECLESLKKTKNNNFTVIIVDNASIDNSVNLIINYLCSENNDYLYIDMKQTNINLPIVQVLPKFVFIRSDHNGGYGYGNNLGIKFALRNGADYIMILNNDTVVSFDFLALLIEMCESNKEIGIASGKIYFYGRPDVIWFNGGAFYEWTGKIEHFNFNEKDMGQSPKKEITFISGCMWLVPREVFEKVGLINEEYFMYVEDLEFCYRVRKAGYKLAVNPNSKIWHKVDGAEKGYLSLFSVFWTYRNMIYFIIKNYPYVSMKIIAISCVVIRNFFRFLKYKDFKLIKTYLKGILKGFIKALSG